MNEYEEKARKLYAQLLEETAELHGMVDGASEATLTMPEIGAALVDHIRPTVGEIERILAKWRELAAGEVENGR